MTEKIKKAASKSKGFAGEFREFIMRGNVMDMAVGVIIGGAFQKIISSLVDDIIMPIISIITAVIPAAMHIFKRVLFLLLCNLYPPHLLYVLNIIF